MGTNGHCLVLGLPDIWLSPHYRIGRSSGYSRLTDSSDLHKYIGATVSGGTQELCHCYTLTRFESGRLSIATDFLCLRRLRYNKPHIWVTYKNGAPVPYASA
jgi:hypothetical protein